MTLPLQLLFWIDSASLKSGRYQETIEHYRALFCPKLGKQDWPLPRPYAYITLTDADKHLLPDCIDHLLDLDVMPIAQDGTQVRERGVTDLLFAIDRPEFQQLPFMLHIRGDYRIQPAAGQNLMEVLNAAISTLHVNHTVVSIGFPGSFNLFQSEQVNQVYSAAQFVRWPAVVRTRDLWLAALLEVQQGSAKADQALSAFSYSPTRHLSFNQSVAVTL